MTEVAIGNRVSGPPELRSRRWPLGLGAGLVALLFDDPPAEMIARARASMLALRLLSSVLIARGRRVSTLVLCEREEARFNSEKMASLWAKRSRMRRYEYLSSIVIDVSVLGRNTQGASALPRAVMYASSAEVSSMRRVKWVMRASRVAMLARRSWLRVFWRTEIRAGSLDSAAVVE